MMRSLFFLSLSLTASAVWGQQLRTSVPVVRMEDLSTVRADTFSIKAIVRSIYLCPPCPEGMICKPCEGDHVVISGDKAQTFAKVFMSRPITLTEGKSYLFTVRWLNPKHHASGTSLISYKSGKNKSTNRTKRDVKE